MQPASSFSGGKYVKNAPHQTFGPVISIWSPDCPVHEKMTLTLKEV